jgi:alcohol dehydrogenase
MFYEFFIEKHACDECFIQMAKAMGITDASRPEDFITALAKLQEDCGVANLKMSEYCVNRTLSHQ